MVKPGCGLTVKVALAVPLRPEEELRVPEVFSMAPAAVPITSTWMRQLLPAATLPPLRLKLPLPAVAVNVPPQLLLLFAGVAITSPAGKLSVKARLFAARAEALLSMVKLSLLGRPKPTEVGAKLFANAGGGSTVSVALAGCASVSPSWVRGLVVLVKLPAVADTGTDRLISKVQLPPAGRLPPVKVRKELPVSEEPAPQGLPGRLLAVSPVTTLLKSSEKARSEIGVTALLF